MKEDLISECVLGMVEGREMYDESKGAMTTYLWACGKNKVLRYVREVNKVEKNVVDIDVNEIGWGEEENEPIVYECFEDRIEEFIACDDVRKKEKTKNIEREYLRGAKCSDIARKYGVSRQLVSKIIIRLQRAIKRNYDFVDGKIVRKEREWEL